jgi:carboxymethylenebutenolidase
MERKRASDFPQAVLDLFDGYQHGFITRREFLDRAAKFAAGGVGAAALLESLRPNYAWAEEVRKDDSRIHAEYVKVPSPQGNGEVRGYLVRPAKETKRGCVVVYHENRGLNPYIEDVARRVAVAGYDAFAPDALTPVGGYPGDEEKAVKLFSSLDPAKRTEDLIAAAEWLKKQPTCNGKLGAVGFCFGGGMVNTLATRMPDLAAAVPFYGAQPSAEATARIKAPLLIHYAGLDARIDGGWPAWEEALKAHGVRYEMHMYPNVNHGFHNDTTPRYDEAAAKLAWSRTLDFFAKHLAG